MSLIDWLIWPRQIKNLVTFLVKSQWKLSNSLQQNLEDFESFVKVLIDKVPQSKGFTKIGNGTTFCLFWNSNKTESNEYGTNFKGNAFQLRATQFDHLMWTSILFLLVFIDGVKPNFATKLCGTSDYQLLRSEGINFILWTIYLSNQVLGLTNPFLRTWTL